MVTEQTIEVINEAANAHNVVKGLSGANALTLVVMTLGAIAMPNFAKRIAIPVAVAEILYGFIIGASGLDLVGDPNDPFIQFLSDLGFAFFLFLAGLEIDFKDIENRLHELFLPFVLSSLAFAFSMSITAWLDMSIWVGLATGATAVPLLLSVVREMRLGGTYLGTTMIAFAAMGELITIFLLSALEIHTLAHGDFGEIVFGFVLLGALVAVAVMGASLLRTLNWWRPSLFRKMVAHDDPSEFGIRVGFAMMFFFIGLSIIAHVEPFLGAFVAGAILSFVIRDKGALEHKLSSMAYGFFVPIFFIHVGMRLNITVDLLINNYTSILIIIGIMFAVKFIPSILLLLRGFSFSQLIATCSLLAAPLTLVIAIMELGYKNQAVEEETSVIVITAGILASLLYPSLARKLLNSDTPSGESKELASSSH
jgi:Kef-type K+ transport system membrane component KefB